MTGSKIYAFVGCLWLVCPGCSFTGPKAWVKETQEIRFDTGGLVTLEARTHNGAVSFATAPAGQAEGVVAVKKKAGGRNKADAREAMRAIEVYSERTPEGMLRLGWKWTTVKHSTWQARVSFDILAPGQLNLDAQTHNGAIRVDGVTGNVKTVTHNGAIQLASQGGTLHAETHNGKIDVSYAGPNLKVITHNGEIVADLEKCGAVSGSIETYNGGIRILVGDSTAADLICRTTNGSIHTDAPLQAVQSSRHKLAGTLGAGGGSLDVSTHNGSVRIKKAG